jgi:hypothetical protein
MNCELKFIWQNISSLDIIMHCTLINSLDIIMHCMLKKYVVYLII